MTLDGTQTFVVGDRQTVVIDPGPDDPAHLDAIEHALSGSAVQAILLTHIHPDHAAGAEALAARVGAPIWRGREADDRWPEVRADHWLSDGDIITTDRGLLRPVGTPGHSPDHHVFAWSADPAAGGPIVFVGDLLMGEGDTTLVAAPEGDLALYLASLDRLKELAANRYLPAHGPPIDDPATAVRRYRAHREQRIEQVAAIQADAGPIDSSEMVSLIYGESLNPSLAAAAEGSIRAILAYLKRHDDLHTPR